MSNAEPLKWIDAKENPPEPGLIVKRWNNGNVWAGYYSGTSKDSAFDHWVPLSDSL